MKLKVNNFLIFISILIYFWDIKLPIKLYQENDQQFVWNLYENIVYFQEYQKRIEILLKYIPNLLKLKINNQNLI